jgi:hypothetical protein
MLPKSFNKHLFPALLLGLGLRIFLLCRFPFASGDTPYYEELALRLQRSHDGIQGRKAHCCIRKELL